jgi:hypothetical protein
VAGNTPFWNGSNWVLNSSNIFNNGGNVGIGTTVPSTKLDVSGDFRVERPAVTGAEVISTFKVSDDTSTLNIENLTTTSNVFASGIIGRNSGTSACLALQGRATTDTGTISIVQFSARIGETTTVSTRPLFTWNNFATEVMRINANGNVGIGTTSPSEKLDVAGQTQSQTFKVSSSGTANYTVNGNLIIDASSIQFATWSASFTANRTLQISNLADGKWIEIVIVNTNATARTITIQASQTTSGYSNVLCSNGSGGATALATLNATLGFRTVRIFAAGTNIAGSIH